MKQLANQNLGRAEKSEVLSDELLELERRIHHIRLVCTDTSEKLSNSLPATGVNSDRCYRNLSQSVLSKSLYGSAVLLGNEHDSLGLTYKLCSEAQSRLANALVQHSVDVERQVLEPLNRVVQMDIPVIIKLRKQLTKLTLDMDAAKCRYQSVIRQQQPVTSGSTASLAPSTPTTAMNKVDAVRTELDEAESRVETCKDQLMTEIYSFLSRECELNRTLLALLEAQAAYHRSAVHSLDDILPQVRTHFERDVQKSVFGCSLGDHLRHVNADISVVIEQCVCALLRHGLREEGLFRVAASGVKVRKLKSAFDAGLIRLDDCDDYDVHCIAGVLKLYLRELPEPLMTFELYDEWMRLVTMLPSTRQNSMWVVVDKLPIQNYNNLRYLIKFLARLAEHSEQNKMTAANLAIVFAPSLLRCADSVSDCDDINSLASACSSGLQTATAHHSIVEQLISKAEWFFPGDVDYSVSSLRRPSRLSARRCNSACNDDVVPTIPVSCDAITLMSLPTFHLNQSQTASSTGAAMSSSMLRPTDSLSSFTSLHSLPEPFLITQSPSDSMRRTTALTVSRLSSSVDTRSQTSTKLRVNGVTHHQPHATAVSVDHDIDAVTNADTSKKAKVGKEAALTSSSASSSGVVSGKAVLGQLIRAKTITSKTLRRFGPKLTASLKSVGGGSGVENPVQRSASLAQRFRLLRTDSASPRSNSTTSVAIGGRKVRERSPLAASPSAVVQSTASCSVDVDESATAQQMNIVPPRRVLFGASSLHDNHCHCTYATEARRSFRNHGRTASCVDDSDRTEWSDISTSRPRSTEPPPRHAVVVEPSCYQINQSKHVQSSVSHGGGPGNNTVPTTSQPALPLTSSPRMASPETSSLSSGSPASVFSRSIPAAKYRSESIRNGSIRSLTTDMAVSMSDLSQWELPKLDIDLGDQFFLTSSHEVSGGDMDNWLINDGVTVDRSHPAAEQTTRDDHQKSVSKCSVDIGSSTKPTCDNIQQHSTTSVTRHVSVDLTCHVSDSWADDVLTEMLERPQTKSESGTAASCETANTHSSLPLTSKLVLARIESVPSTKT